MKSLSDLVQQHNPVEFEAEKRDKAAKRFIALVLDATTADEIDVTEADFQAISHNLRRSYYPLVILLLCVFFVIHAMLCLYFPDYPNIAIWIVFAICTFLLKRDCVDAPLSRLRIQPVNPE